MDKYRVHNVTIRKEDRDKADAIIEKHYLAGDIDEVYTEKRAAHVDGELIMTVSYWISPYICEDLQIIIDEFKQEGIQII
jgi:hypothetical protein